MAGPSRNSWQNSLNRDENERFVDDRNSFANTDPEFGRSVKYADRLTMYNELIRKTSEDMRQTIRIGMDYNRFGAPPLNMPYSEGLHMINPNISCRPQLHGCFCSPALLSMSQNQINPVLSTPFSIPYTMETMNIQPSIHGYMHPSNPNAATSSSEDDVGFVEGIDCDDTMQPNNSRGIKRGHPDNFFEDFGSKKQRM